MSGPQRLCWSCDAVVPGKVQFCPNCNALQKEIAEEMLAEPRVRGSVNMTSSFIVLGVIVLLIAGAIWWMNQTRDTRPQSAADRSSGRAGEVWSGEAVEPVRKSQ